MKPPMLYSQNDEQTIIEAYFKSAVPGRFLDIGAYDGKTFSNTFRLLELGWVGTCVEPDPYAFVRMMDIHRQFGFDSQVLAINMAVVSEPGPVHLYCSRGGGVSTTQDAHRDKWQSASPFCSMWVGGVTVPALLSRLSYPIDMLNIDVEGNSAELLTTFPLRGFGTRLVCVEHDGKRADVINYCSEHGLTTVLCDNAENIIMAA